MPYIFCNKCNGYYKISEEELSDNFNCNLCGMNLKYEESVKKMDKQKKIRNPFAMNDWGIKDFFIAIFALNIFLLILTGLDYLNIHIPIMKELLSFIFITFIPGLLILRIFKLHKLGSTKSIVYSVGLSISSLMFLGFLINMLYPFIGISNPISFNYLMLSIEILIFLLAIMAYLQDKEYSNPDFIDLNILLSPQFLFICLLPFLAILGTYLMNSYNNNILIFILLLLIGITVFLTASGKFLSKELFPFAVFILTITILYHTVLISNHVWGGDIQVEYYLSSLVIKNSIWDYSYYDNYNSMLSVVMLLPIYSIILKVNSTWIIKMIYPFFLSMVPLTLFIIYKEQTNNKIAFLACFFFISIYGFYNELAQMLRQQIGELFLVLFFLAVLDTNLTKTKKYLLYIIFGASIIVSHYGISYFLVFYLIIFMLVYFLYNEKSLFKLINILKFNFFKSKIKSIINLKLSYFPFKLLKNSIIILKENISINFLENETKSINPYYISIFILILLSWQICTSSSSIIENVIQIIYAILGSLISHFMDPNAVQSLGIIIQGMDSVYRAIAKNLYLFSQLLILIGFLSILFTANKMNFKKDYMAFSIASIFMLFLSVTVPYLSNQLNTGRMFQISLILLSPFIIIGGLSILKVLGKIKRIKGINKANISVCLLSVYLIVFFLFSSGLVFQICGDKPSSIALNNNIDTYIFNDKDFTGSEWLYDKKIEMDKGVYADSNRDEMFASFGMPYQDLPEYFDDVEYWGSYVFLGTWNTVNHSVNLMVWDNTVLSTQYSKLNDDFIEGHSLIYSNGGVVIFYPGGET